jgi:thymidylate synthase ThyX
MKTKINAQIVAHSKNEQGDELISVLATFPRIILAEVNTHRMLSKNTSSSRAIPFKKMVETIQNDPFIPIAWQRGHSGMQGEEYLTAPIDLAFANDMWLEARDRAVKSAKAISKEGTDGVPFVTKQLANRLLEPFMWTTMLITGPKSGWDNFFNLRCPVYQLPNKEETFKSWKELTNYYEEKYHDFWTGLHLENYTQVERLKVNKGQAEIHMMALAECIYDAYMESTPKQLKAGEWHIPFEYVIVKDEIKDTKRFDSLSSEEIINRRVKVSVAMAARTSYTVVGEEKRIDYEAMIGLHDRLLAQDPPHSSPLEHCARAMSNEEYSTYLKGVIELIDIDEPEYNGGIYEPKHSEKGWCNNFKGFIPYRYFVDNGATI